MIDDTISFIESIVPGINQGIKYNQYSSRPLELKLNEVNADLFNKLYKYLLNSDLNTPIIRTDAGSIRKGPKYRCNDYAWDVKNSNIGVRLTICLAGKIYVFKLGSFKSDKEPGIYPNQAWAKFVEACADKGINIDDYKISNGEEVKKQIEKPYINMKYHMTAKDPGLDNVHHIDFHNSYPAGLCNTHPEFRPVIEPIYEQRKDPKFTNINKAILNFSVGWMQSYEPKKGRFASWAGLAKDAIHDNNNRIEEMSFSLTITGREVIGYNTDGIWYRGDIYHGDGEGDKLGEWHNDHTNCLFRSKSDGAYEFIENGKYKAVIRGTTSYDAVEMNRNDWQWGDIFKGSLYTFKFDKLEGVIYEKIKD